MSYQGRIGAIGTEPRSTSKPDYTTELKKFKQPNISRLLSGVGSLINNLPNNFNSAFTVGQGANVQGAFGD